MRKFCYYFTIIILLISCADNYQKGEKELLLEHYENAKYLFQKVEKGNENYSKAQLKIIEIENKLKRKTVTLKIDSIEKIDQSETEISNPVIEVENNQENIQKIESLDESKRKVRQLYNSLMAFKNNSDFHEVGFAVCCQYNNWMKEIELLRHSKFSDSLENQGYSLIDLQQIGLAYLRSKGKETEFTIYAKKHSLWAVK